MNEIETAAWMDAVNIAADRVENAHRLVGIAYLDGKQEPFDDFRRGYIACLENLLRVAKDEK